MFILVRRYCPKWFPKPVIKRSTHLYVAKLRTHPLTFMLQNYELIHSPLCCKTTMQTNCGLTNCTGSSPETVFSFSFWRLVKSWVSNRAGALKVSILHSYFYYCLCFRRRCQALKNRGVKREGQRGTITKGPNHYGAPNHCGGSWKFPTMSKVLSSLQYTGFRKTSVSNMGAPKLLLAPGSI